MEKEFTPYEQSLELKELGFDEPCFGYYYPEAYSEETILMDSALDPNHTYYNEFPNKGDLAITYNYNEQFISAPLYQQAFTWFREKYNLFNRPDFDVEYIDELDEFRTTYFFSILKMEESLIGFKPLGRLNNEKTYKEAELECLKKLIQIVKEQK